MEWGRTFASVGDDRDYSVQVTSDGGSDVWLIKTDADGDVHRLDLLMSRFV